MSLLTHRIFYVTVGRPFLRRLIPAFTIVLLVVVSVDAMVDWAAVRDGIASLAPLKRATLFTAGLTAWGIAAGRALRPVWSDPMVGFLVRQPLSRWQWAAGLAPSLAVAFLPPAALWSLAPHHGAPLADYLAFTGLSWPIVLGASFAFPSALIVLIPACAVLALLMTVYWQFPSMTWLATVVAAVQIAHSVSLIPRQIHRPIHGNGLRLSAPGPITAILRRDLRCLFRMERRCFIRLALSSVVACSMMLALRVNGAIAGKEAFLAACVLVSLPAATAFGMLEKLRARLGTEFTRLRWPVTSRQRALALVTLIAFLLAPADLTLAVIGASMGAAWLLLFALFTGVTILVCASLLAQALSSATSALPAFLLALTLHGCLALALPAWSYAALALPVMVMAGYRIHSGLWKFAIQAEWRTDARGA